MKKNAGNNDPYVLTLNNLCTQMYQNSDGHRGLIPQFDNSCYTRDLLSLQSDHWDGGHLAGMIRLCSDESFQALVGDIYFAHGEAETPLRNLFLFLHFGGWKDIFDIRWEKEQTNDTERFKNTNKHLFEGSSSLYKRLRDELSSSPDLFEILAKRNRFIFDKTGVENDALKQMIEGFVKRNEGNLERIAPQAMLYITRCLGAYEGDGTKIYLDYAFVCLLLSAGLKPQYVTKLCFPNEKKTVREVSLPGVISVEDAITNLRSAVRRGTYVNRPAVLEEIRSRMEGSPPQRIVSLVGEGGSGKTETALEYAQSVSRQYRQFYYLIYPDSYTVKLSMDQLLQNNRCNTNSREWGRDTMVIIDNMNCQWEAEEWKQYVEDQTGDARILITGRTEDAPGAVVRINQVNEDREQLYLEVFRRYYDCYECKVTAGEEPLVRKIVNRFPNLMMVTIIATSLKACRQRYKYTQRTIRQFCRRMEETEILSPKLMPKTEVSIRKDQEQQEDLPERMLQRLFYKDLLSFEMEPQQRKLASQLLTVLSRFPGQPMPGELLLETLGDTYEEDAMSSVAYTLDARGWVTYNTSLLTITLHPVIAHVLCYEDADRPKLIPYVKTGELAGFYDHLFQNMLVLDRESYATRILAPFAHQLLRSCQRALAEHDTCPEPSETVLLFRACYYPLFRTFFGMHIDMLLKEDLAEHFPRSGFVGAVEFEEGKRFVYYPLETQQEKTVLDLSRRCTTGRYYQADFDPRKDHCGENRAVRSEVIQSVLHGKVKHLGFPDRLCGAEVETVGDFCCGDEPGFDDVVKVTLPGRVRDIGESAFRNCEGRWTAEFPETVRTLGPNCFLNSGLSGNVTLPPSLQVIPAHAFEGCSHMTSLTLPSNTDRIGLCAFADCHGLTDSHLTIPPSVTVIGDFAFFETGIHDMEYGQPPSYIGNHAFSGCTTSLRELEYRVRSDVPTDGYASERYPENKEINRNMKEYVDSFHGIFPTEYKKGENTHAWQSMSLVQHVMKHLFGFDLYDGPIEKRFMDTPGAMSLKEFLAGNKNSRMARSGDFIWIRSDNGESWNILINDFDDRGVWLTGGIECSGTGYVHFNCTKVSYGAAGMAPYRNSRWVLYLMPDVRG